MSWLFLKDRSRFNLTNIIHNLNQMKAILAIFLLLMYFAVCDGEKICFGDFGGTHLNVYKPLIDEIIRRGHMTSIVVNSPSFKRTRAMIGNETESLIYLKFETNKLTFPQGLMNAMGQASKFGDILMQPRMVDLVSRMVEMHRAALTDTHKSQLSELCKIFVLDPFEFHLADFAREINIPVVFTMFTLPSLTPPPFPLWPIPSAMILPANSESNLLRRFCLDTAGHLSSIVFTTLAFWKGLKFYGYPRHLFSTVYSRPYFALSRWSSTVAALPPSVIVLGVDEVPKSANSTVTIVDNIINVTAAVSCKKEIDGVCPSLVVGPQRLLFAAFGTLVHIPTSLNERLCSAFVRVLDSGEVDAVVFGRRVLGESELTRSATEGENHRTIPVCPQASVCESSSIEGATQEEKPQSGLTTTTPGRSKHDNSAARNISSCNDPRIRVTQWVQQSDILASGAVGLFVSHGGYSSLHEAYSNRVPTAILPFFGDQPINAAAMQHKGTGVALTKTDSDEQLANGMLSVLRNRSQYLARMEDFAAMDAVLSGGRCVHFCYSHEIQVLVSVVLEGRVLFMWRTYFTLPHHKTSCSHRLALLTILDSFSTRSRLISPDPTPQNKHQLHEYKGCRSCGTGRQTRSQQCPSAARASRMVSLC